MPTCASLHPFCMIRLGIERLVTFIVLADDGPSLGQKFLALSMILSNCQNCHVMELSSYWSRPCLQCDKHK